MKIFKKVLVISLIFALTFGCIEVSLNQLGYDDIFTYAISYDDRAMIDIPSLSQEHIPTGCESVSTVMALNWHGLDISIDDFINTYLEKSDIIFKDGQLWADNPNDSFIGNPYDSNSFGCYAPVIVNSVNKILNESNLNGLKVKNLTGVGLRKICRDYVSNGIPVIVWATIDMQPSVKGKTWNIIGTKDESFTWTSKEHCLLLVGYDGEYYYFNDPQHQSDSAIKYDRSLVERRYRELGSQAVVIY